MKKILGVLLLCLSATASFADTEQDFIRQKLSIESGLITWTPTQGFGPIKEYRFLEIAGYPEQAKQAIKHARQNGMLIGLGVGMAIGGASSYIYSLSLISNPTNEIFYWLIGGVITMVISPIPVLAAVLRGKWMPLEQAYAIAEDYNERLMKSLVATEK